MFDCLNIIIIIIIIINHHNLYLILFSVYQHDDPFSTRLLRQSILAAPPRHRSRPRSTSAAAFTHPDKLEQDQNYQDHPSCVFPTIAQDQCLRYIPSMLDTCTASSLAHWSHLCDPHNPRFCTKTSTVR